MPQIIHLYCQVWHCEYHYRCIRLIYSTLLSDCCYLRHDHRVPYSTVPMLFRSIPGKKTTCTLAQINCCVGLVLLTAAVFHLIVPYILVRDVLCFVWREIAVSSTSPTQQMISQGVQVLFDRVYIMVVLTSSFS